MKDIKTGCLLAIGAYFGWTLTHSIDRVLGKELTQYINKKKDKQ